MKIIDGWFVRRFDLAGHYLQTTHGWHIVDIWKFGTAFVLSLMTVFMLMTLTNLIPLFTVAPYAIMWGFYLVIVLPWLSRQKQTWSIQRMAWWSLWTERLRLTLPLMRLMVMIMVLVFAFGPSIGNYIYGYQESWGRFALTVIGAIIRPGGIIFATYLMGIHPVPPYRKVPKKEVGLAKWFAEPEVSGGR